ncbi:ABC transporter permease [Jeongeupia sp. USM3]|uniref:ABC transporter permease n=1 Tax=Jeongeupia sp. USM3 TaxID=1906741 RepID=UPI00089DE760|nr:ABC transporter permease [Jeongeupia sp. USM3]AOX99968.1 sulfonate ABC transporter [Jeongeupia sp. USM3]
MAMTEAIAVPAAPVAWGPALATAGTRLWHGALALILPLSVLVLWHSATANGWVAQQILPAPKLVWTTLLELWGTGELWTNLAISLTRVAWGFSAALVIGLALGVAMGLSKTAEAYLYPSFKAISEVPVLGWIPLLIMLVGIGEAMKIIVIAKAAAVPITINTQQGIRNIPQQYLEVARVYRFKPVQLWRRVIFPSTLPSLFNGFRYGLTNAWLSLVTVELLASSEGIGYQMVWGRQLFQLDVVMACMAVIGLVGLAIDLFLQITETRLLRWRRTAL